MSLSLSPGLGVASLFAFLGVAIALGAQAADSVAEGKLKGSPSATASVSGALQNPHPGSVVDSPVETETAPTTEGRPSGGELVSALPDASAGLPALRPDAMSLPNQHGMPWPGDGSWADGLPPQAVP